MILSSTLSNSKIPNKIVSLVPSITSLLHYLNLDHQICGITKFCTKPASFKRKKNIIGGTKNIQVEKIVALNPDLIIANKEENQQADVETLAASFPVWLTDVKNLADNYQMIQDIGELTGAEMNAKKLVQDIKNQFELHQPVNKRKINVVYLIWKDPYMTIGGDTFIHDMLEHGGFNNLFSNTVRYPKTTLDEITAMQPEAIFLSSEPYPFSNKHLIEIQKKVGDIDIFLVKGEFFSWYGHEILHSPLYFKELQNLCYKSGHILH